MVTIVFPGPSSLARRIAPATFIPLDPPMSRPSSSRRSKQTGIISSSGMRNASSIFAPSRFPVTRPWPMPSVIELPSDLSSPVFHPAEDGRTHGISHRRDDFWILLFQVFANPRQRASGSHRANECVRLSHPSVPIFPVRCWRDGPPGSPCCPTDSRRGRHAVPSL